MGFSLLQAGPTQELRPASGAELSMQPCATDDEEDAEGWFIDCAGFPCTRSLKYFHASRDHAIVSGLEEATHMRC
jgi:hypothetical protein